MNDPAPQRPLPPSLQVVTWLGDELVPGFLLPRDRPWLRALMDLQARFAGRPRRELRERLREPVGQAPDRARVNMAQRVLDELSPRATARPGVDPRQARRELFLAAGRASSREQAWGEASAALGLEPLALDALLFADQASEKPVPAPPPDLSPEELLLRVNLALAQGLLMQALEVEIEARGNARPLVRQAHLDGLICSVERAPESGGTILRASGPCALFRRTLLYGRALSRLLPLLPWCAWFRLRARLVLDGREGMLRLQTGDPLAVAPEPRRFDSRLEERLWQDLGRLVGGEWELVREPEPVDAGGQLAFPDFQLVNREDPSRRAWVELVGFWTPSYLANKLARLRAAGLPNLVLAVDARRGCSNEELPVDAALVPFKGTRVPAAEVLAAVEALTAKL